MLKPDERKKVDAIKEVLCEKGWSGKRLTNAIYNLVEEGGHEKKHIRRANLEHNMEALQELAQDKKKAAAAATGGAGAASGLNLKLTMGALTEQCPFSADSGAPTRKVVGDWRERNSSVKQ